ncbi:CCR4-NOT transcription complex subunit 9 [Skeletonema marinoi]|uniref:CCR4-NOT transcription complex subunit 9 n=1 Tax=Skeletonema marinoi TaxID=267567 RepID=A0AAD8Y954_9STRA|nr:CCR4-NOT transcription complex subunit 9 [Skeletonema marinoi]
MNFGSSDAQSNSYSNLSGLVVGGPQQQQQQQIQVGGLGGLGGTPANTPPSSSTTSPATNNTTTTTNNSNNADTIDDLHILILQLTNPDQRESVLLELSKKRESFPDLAPILWHTFGTVSALLQEIVSIYPLLTPPTLTAHASNRVCNALALLQCVASHPDTRGLFLSAHIPLYLYPFLNTQSKSRPFEYLRLTSLGVIGALVKMDDADVINFLLQTEIIPLCLRIMEAGSELSKTVATFIVQKILLDDVGLGYVCATAERFYAVSTVLNNMVGSLVLNPSVRLLKHIVRCYLRLSDNGRARDALKQALPSSLRDDTFANALRDDSTVTKWLNQLLQTVGNPPEGGGGSNAGIANLSGPSLMVGPTSN